MRLIGKLAVLAGVFAIAGCELFNTTDSENATGRGPRSFDPYAGSASGAIRLGLQMYNGCAIRATGEPVAPGTAKFPYPTDCATAEYQGSQPLDKNRKPFELLAGTRYFLNQITLMDAVEGVHKDPTDLTSITSWFKTQTHFKDLDWNGLGVIGDHWDNSEEIISPYSFRHKISFGNANWQNVKDDTFLIEILNGEGTVVQQFTYSHSDFLAENSIAGHSAVAWEANGIQAPQFIGDNSIRPSPPPPSDFPPGSAPTFRTYVRMDLVTQIHPTNAFTLDAGLIGDGAIRLTWSQLPNEPFYFPVTFVKKTDLPPTCLSGSDAKTPVPCGFGIQPEVTLAPPMNGKTFYEPGETVRFTLAIKDGDGNYLHPLDHFPSWNEYAANQANGLLYLNFFHLDVLHESDTVTAYSFAGPIHKMYPFYDFSEQQYFQPLESTFIPSAGHADFALGGSFIAGDAFPDGRDAKLPTTYSVTLPQNAEPGTYILAFKVNRQFLGERFTKMIPFYVQVGNATPTQFPGRVGNCQICHRGTISLDNVRHGATVDMVEGCKLCHSRVGFVSGRNVSFQRLLHMVHTSSSKYPLPKNNCTVCHLTRESTLRPSYLVCSSCHPEPHGTQYLPLEYQTDFDPNNSYTVFGNCAAQCHQNTPPTQHILPSQ